MQDRIHEHAIFILYCLAAVSGGLGGCTVAAHQLLQGKRSMRASFFFAYLIIGVAFGIVTAACGLFAGGENYTDIVAPALIAGAAGSLILGTMNMGARVILKYLGVEVVVTVRREGEPPELSVAPLAAPPDESAIPDPQQKETEDDARN